MSDPSSQNESDLVLRGNQIPAGILHSSLKSDRISNAYLFKGPKGAPKEALALEFAKGLLCDTGEPRLHGSPCGTCWSCRAVSNHAHPDLIEVEKDGAAIKIKASHEMLKEALTRPYHSARKVFIIKDAEDMTVEASNALLKVLEEPPAYVTFLLTAANVRSIPETIISRCQTLPFRKLPSDVLREILVTYHGLSGDEAEAAATYGDGSVERALWIAGRSKDRKPGESVLDEIARSSPVELAQKYAKTEPSRRVDVLLDLEIELVRRLRAQAVLESDGGQRLYRAVNSLQRAKERLRCNVNPFLTFSVLFMDLAHLRREGE